MYVTELVRKEGFRRGLRCETIKTYILCLNKFFRIYKLVPTKVTKNDLLCYMDQLRAWGKAESTIHVHLNALKFFYEHVLHKKLTLKIPSPKIRKRLPEFLTQEETTRLFMTIPHKKHQLIIKLLYASGMRVGELVKLKVNDFQFDDNYGWIRDGKGGKDGLFIIAAKLKNELMLWISTQKLQSDSWLFPGRGSEHISKQMIQLIMKRAARQANIAKNVHPHTLRHSFATHLIQNGYAVTEVQPLLGHSSVNTTMIYLHLASPQLLKVQSPYDHL